MTMTKLTIEVSNPIFVSRVAGTDISVDLREMPNAALVEFLRYGVQRKGNDGNGGADVSDATKIAAAKARFANFKAGTITQPRGSAKSPLERELGRIAETAFLAKLKAANLASRAAAEKKYGKEKVAEMLAKFTELNRDAFTKTAQKNLDNMAKQAVGIESIDDLMTELGIDKPEATASE